MKLNSIKHFFGAISKSLGDVSHDTLQSLLYQ